MKIFLSLIIALAAAGTAYGQKSYLDVEQNAPCELFTQKTGYEWQQRLSQMDSLENQIVTVFEVRGTDYLIKTEYTGKVTITGKKEGKPRKPGQATVLTVVEDMEDGKSITHLAPTDNKNIRIYLKSCLLNN